jgi:hypothetical protein
MTIFSTTRPMHNDDRRALWDLMRSAYLNYENAIPLFAVSAINKFNLLSVPDKDRIKWTGTADSNKPRRFLPFCIGGTYGKAGIESPPDARRRLPPR